MNIAGKMSADQFNRIVDLTKTNAKVIILTRNLHEDSPGFENLMKVLLD